MKQKNIVIAILLGISCILGVASVVEYTMLKYQTGRIRQMEADTEVAEHGALAVSGVELVDEKGQKFQLRGISSHGILQRLR